MPKCVKLIWHIPDNCMCYVHTYTHIHTHTNILTHKHTHIHTYTQTHTHTYTHTRTQTRTHKHTHTHIHAHTRAREYIYIYIYIYIHTAVYNKSTADVVIFPPKTVVLDKFWRHSRTYGRHIWRHDHLESDVIHLSLSAGAFSDEKA